MSDKILLQQLEIHAPVGVTAAEQEIGQRLRVSVELWLDLRAAGESDDLNDTVSYAAVAEQVEESVMEGPTALLERVADRIARALLSRFPVEAARVQVLKVPPPIPMSVAAAGVEILRRADADMKRVE